MAKPNSSKRQSKTRGAALPKRPANQQVRRFSRSVRFLFGNKKRALISTLIAASLAAGTVGHQFWMKHRQPVASMQFGPREKMTFWMGQHVTTEHGLSFRRVIEEKLNHKEKVHAIATESVNTREEQQKSVLALDREQQYFHNLRTSGISPLRLEQLIRERVEQKIPLDIEHGRFVKELVITALLYDIPLVPIEHYDAPTIQRLDELTRMESEWGKKAARQPTFMAGLGFARKAVEAEREMLMIRNNTLERGLEGLFSAIKQTNPDENIQVVGAFGRMHENLSNTKTKNGRDTQRVLEAQQEVGGWLPLLSGTLEEPLTDVLVVRIMLGKFASSIAKTNEKAIQGAGKATWNDFLKINELTKQNNPQRNQNLVRMLEQIADRK